MDHSKLFDANLTPSELESRRGLLLASPRYAEWLEAKRQESVMDIRRMWINQPSTLQPLHHLHGVNVLAIRDGNDWRVYFLSGDIVSQQMPTPWLSEGWR